MGDSHDIIRIQQYLKGELNPEEMNALERQALEDPLLNDAIEGFTETGIKPHKLTLLQQRLQERVTEQPQEHSRMLFNSQRLGIAAVACLLFILSCVLLWMINAKNMKDAGQTKQVTMELSTKDPIPVGNDLFIARKLTEESASPKGGWEAFNQYVKENKRILSGSNSVSVIMQFEIDAVGKPKNIRSAKDQSSFTEEAKRLIKNGPTWVAGQHAEVEFVFE
ncbi:hypothetical protein H8S90_06255 [Olivibacter sp. SDN3]|uniref:hypothetical protein n=1 Tax=Olivibacter sp. SDN3 TaxID=2764720 RepID=UPI0016514D1A|nr:hypothetical protein [Olivibacter sp. SDN3]QNL51183.1 hypothetical protein H8S90_06255 [Olivibacter sp. SDN3]